MKSWIEFVVFFSWKLGPSNRGLATKLELSTEKTYIPAEVFSKAKVTRNSNNGVESNSESHPVWWFYCFVHLFKTCRNHLLDDIVTLPCQSKVSVYDFYDLLNKFKTKTTSDHNSGFHMTEDDLLVESTDRQNMTSAMKLLR